MQVCSNNQTDLGKCKNLVLYLYKMQIESFVAFLVITCTLFNVIKHFILIVLYFSVKSTTENAETEMLKETKTILKFNKIKEWKEGTTIEIKKINEIF